MNDMRTRGAFREAVRRNWWREALESYEVWLWLLLMVLTCLPTVHRAGGGEAIQRLLSIPEHGSKSSSQGRNRDFYH